MQQTLFIGISFSILLLGLDCRLLPPCLNNLEGDIPGVNCQRVEFVDENFQIDTAELPDFDPKDFFGEETRSDFESLPQPLTTPSPSSRKNEEGLQQKTNLLEPVRVGQICQKLRILNWVPYVHFS